MTKCNGSCHLHLTKSKPPCESDKTPRKSRRRCQLRAKALMLVASMRKHADLFILVAAIATAIFSRPHYVTFVADALQQARAGTTSTSRSLCRKRPCLGAYTACLSRCFDFAGNPCASRSPLPDIPTPPSPTPFIGEGSLAYSLWKSAKANPDLTSSAYRYPKP